MLYVYSATQITPLGWVPSDRTKSDMRYISGRATDPNAPPAGATAGGGGEGGPVLTVQGLPLAKPRYGRITAFDMNKGAIVWQLPHSDTPATTPTHPPLTRLTIPPP